MPVWLATAFAEYGIPLIITLLQRTGFVNKAEALAIKYGLATVEELGKLKTYDEYPIGKNQPVPTRNDDGTSKRG